MLTRQQDMFDPHGRIPLTMALETAVILTPAEVLDGYLDRRVIDHVAKNAKPFDDRLANTKVVAVGEQNDVRELDGRAGFGFAVVYLNHIAFAYFILARTVNKDCVHDDFIPEPASRPENRASRSTPRRRGTIPLRGGGSGATQNGMVANGQEVGYSV